MVYRICLETMGLKRAVVFTNCTTHAVMPDLLSIKFLPLTVWMEVNGLTDA
jgi:hypothetical protein